jgi:hypothetical protein
MNPYLKSIGQYNEAYQWAGSNIQTADGQTAYITRTGVAKPYRSPDEFSKTSGFNGCPVGVISVDASWAALPFGGGMVAGQSCGYEGQYVQAGIPSGKLDWEFYLSYYTDLAASGIATEAQAQAHWDTVGKKEGRLPNQTAISSFAAAGKVGYVDLNTVMHEATPSFTGSYKSYLGKTNVSGANMGDCTTEVPSVNYGDAVYITYQDATATVNTSSNLAFGTSKGLFYIRPPVGSTSTVLHYGDRVSVASSITNSNTSNCGWWGCKVGFVNTASKVFQFGPGGDTGGTPLVVVPPQGYNVGDEVKYGDPWILLATVSPSTTSLTQNNALLPGQQLVSTDGSITFVYGTDGNVTLYNQTAVVWTSDKPHTAGKLLLHNNGNLVAYDDTGAPQWTSSTGGKGVGPYALLVRNNGQVVIVDSSETELWNPTNGSGGDVSSTAGWYGSVVNNILTFSGDNNFTTFTFQPQTALTPSTCNVTAMQEDCNSDPGCLGFVHSPTDNTWQKIGDGASYVIAPTAQDVYLKRATVAPADSACPTAPPKFIDPTLFSNYVPGDPFGAGQCTVDTKPLMANQTAYLDYETKKMNRNIQRIREYEASSQTVNNLTQETSATQSVITTMLNQYSRLLNKFESATSNATYLQQQQDSYIVDKQTQTQLLGWSVLAVVVIGVFLKIRR